MATKTTHALTVLSSPNFHAVEISKVEASIKEQFDRIAAADQEAVFRAIFAGIQLHRVKASLKHGQFGGWLEANIPYKKSQINNFMRLALVAIEKTRMSDKHLLGVSDGCAFELAAPTAQEFVTKLKSFTGELSLTELLIKHGIKGVGMHSELTNEPGGANASPVGDLNAAREQVWQETFNWSQNLRATFSEPSKAQMLTDPKQIELLLADLEETKRMAKERLETLRAQNV